MELETYDSYPDLSNATTNEKFERIPFEAT